VACEEADFGRHRTETAEPATGPAESRPDWRLYGPRRRHRLVPRRLHRDGRAIRRQQPGLRREERGRQGHRLVDSPRSARCCSSGSVTFRAVRTSTPTSSPSRSTKPFGRTATGTKTPDRNGRFMSCVGAQQLLLLRATTSVPGAGAGYSRAAAAAGQRMRSPEDKEDKDPSAATCTRRVDAHVPRSVAAFVLVGCWLPPLAPTCSSAKPRPERLRVMASPAVEWHSGSRSGSAR